MRCFHSLPGLGEHAGLKRIEGAGASPFVPKSDDEFLLLLPSPPPSKSPPWRRLVLDLNGVFVTRADEFMKVRTADPEAIDLLESVPAMKWAGRVRRSAGLLPGDVPRLLKLR